MIEYITNLDADVHAHPDAGLEAAPALVAVGAAVVGIVVAADSSVVAEVAGVDIAGGSV